MDPNYICKYVAKPAVMAAITAGGAAMYHPNVMVYVTGKGSVPLPIVVAGVTFIAAEVSALVNTYLFPHIPQITALEAPAHTALTVGVQTAVTAVVENTISPGLVGDIGVPELFALAAISEVTSTYIVDQWISPILSRYHTV